jgi:hypothetical protein
MKLGLRLALLTTALALAAFGQTLYLGFGPSAHSDSPRIGLNATVGLCDESRANCGLVNYSARFDSAAQYSRGEVVYKTSIAYRRIIATTETSSLRAGVFLLSNAGAVITDSAAAFDGATGGGVSLSPKRYPNWSVSFAAQATYSPVNAILPTDSRWKPDLYAQAGYTFRRSK